MTSHIEQEHPDYASRAGMWRRYRDLYAGGERFRHNGAEYLVRRQKEPAEVYGERLARVFYENYLGSIIDWYMATLVRKEPGILYEGSDERAKAFFNRFALNCDLRGTTLTQFYKEMLTEALVCGKSYIVADFPKGAGNAMTRADEDAAGLSDAYLVGYTADEVINWSFDEKGEFEWVVIRTSCLRQDSVRSFGWKKETRWIYYDTTNYEIYEKREGEDNKIALIERGTHGFAGIRRTPVFDVRIPDGLWLTNKIALLQLEHFNKSNALAWALTMGLFATPVIYSDREYTQVTGESYYVQLGSTDRFGWMEPEGKVFQIAADNLDRLKDEIYRVSYLMQQAGNSTSQSQSGLSKQWDFSVTQEVLGAYGSVMKTSMRNLLNRIAEARKDALIIDVAGLDEFDITSFSSEASDAQSLLNLNVGSPTLRKQVLKRVALKYLSDARQEIKNRVAEEIDTAA
ncbi:MAG TPA: hypothetical protein VKB79_03015 [Bryobacteraceae bacterium]|nr:hypothetical protein [Bryobacteraceae bacterium]